MAAVPNASVSTTYELRGATLSLLALLLKTTDLAELAAQLDAQALDAPGLFDQDPVAIDLSQVREATEAIDFAALNDLLRRHKLQPIAVRRGSAQQMAAALDAGLVEAQESAAPVRMRDEAQEAPLELEMRCYLADVACELHDLRGRQIELPDVYDPASYVASQKLGRELRDAGSNGIAFDSVRRAGGQCLAVFRPRLVQNVRQNVHLRYAWDGTAISEVYEIRAINL